MKTIAFKHGVNRREFCRAFALGGMAATFAPGFLSNVWSQQTAPPPKPATNIDDALKIPRLPHSAPGKFPGRVVEVFHEKSIVQNRPDVQIVSQMLEKGLLELTGAPDLSRAWAQFVSPGDVIGLKVNPVAGRLLSTSLEIVQAIIRQLTDAGISRQNIVIWDRREFELHEVGFTAKNFPDVKITGTEQKDASGSFYDSSGKLYGERMIDREWYYWADCEMTYDPQTLPYMVNQGKHSYFSKIVTRQVDKIINIPILKNAGPSVTLCLKNLAYGSITNTARLHKQLWMETCAQVPCFPPLRDKLVLNIVDGIIGCYEGGPGANAQFITPFHRILIGSDPVAVDQVGYEIILKKRLEEKIQQEELPRARKFLKLAETYRLGIANPGKIHRQKLVMS